MADRNCLPITFNWQTITYSFVSGICLCFQHLIEGYQVKLLSLSTKNLCKVFLWFLDVIFPLNLLCIYHSLIIVFNTAITKCPAGMYFLMYTASSWDVLGCTSPPALRLPSALKMSLSTSLGPREISWSSGMYNPIHPSSRQCAYQYIMCSVYILPIS